MDAQTAMNKIQKLLQLAGGSGAEAEAAAAKATALMERYSIEEAMLCESDPVAKEEVTKTTQDNPLAVWKRNDRWRVRLTSILADQCACRVYFTSRRGRSEVHVIGRPSDVSRLRYLYPFVENQVNRAVELEAVGQGRTWANNYRLGLVEGIKSRIEVESQSMRQDVRRQVLETSGEQGLIRLGKTLTFQQKRYEDARAWEKEHMRYARSLSGSAARLDRNAWAAGRDAAQRINLGGSAKAALGAGAKLLKG